MTARPCRTWSTSSCEHENITIKSNTIRVGRLLPALPAAVKAGKGPDVGVMHLDQLASNAAPQRHRPAGRPGQGARAVEVGLHPEVWDPGIYEGKRYGIPLDVHTLAMYWNQDHFDKAGITDPPTDAASFDEAMKKLKKAGYDTPFWMPNRWPAHLMFLSLDWQHGGEPYAEDGSEATYDDEAGVKAATWMVDQIKKGYSPAKVDQDAQYLAFKNQKTSVTWDGIWQINDLNESGVNWAMSALPTIGDQPASWANSHHFFLTKQAAEDENRANASKAFIGWMSEQSAAWSDAGMIPARNSAREESAYTDSKQYVLNDFLENLHFLPPVPGLGDVQPQTLETAVNEAILQKTPVEEALSKAAQNATKLMEENLKKFGG